MKKIIEESKVCKCCNQITPENTICICDFCKRNQAFMEIRGRYGSEFHDSLSASDVLHLCDDCAKRLTKLVGKVNNEKN